jgi:hypothetical protein
MACPPQGKIPKTMCKKKSQSFTKVGFLTFGTCVASTYNFFQSILAFFFMQSINLIKDGQDNNGRLGLN